VRRRARLRTLIACVDGGRLPGWSGPQMLIVKVFPDTGEGWRRGSAAGASPAVVVMTDAGTGPSVADALLGDDAAQPRTAVGRLAAALGTFHLSTRGPGRHLEGPLAAAEALRDQSGSGVVAESSGRDWARAWMARSSSGKSSSTVACKIAWAVSK